MKIFENFRKFSKIFENFENFRKFFEKFRKNFGKISEIFPKILGDFSEIYFFRKILGCRELAAAGASREASSLLRFGYFPSGCSFGVFWHIGSAVVSKISAP